MFLADKQMRNLVILPLEEFEIFMAQLSAPARDCPKLQSLLVQPSVFDE